MDFGFPNAKRAVVSMFVVPNIIELGMSSCLVGRPDRIVAKRGSLLPTRYAITPLYFGYLTVWHH